MLKELATKLQDFKLDINNTVLDELTRKNYYQVWQEQWGRMTTEAGGDIAMLRLLKIAEQEYSPEDMHLDKMAYQIMVEARYDLDELEGARRVAKEKGTQINYRDVDRPADIYRRWMKPLRFIQQYNFGVGSIIRDIQLEQTMPYGELDSPEWIDPYTGEVDPDAMLERVNFQTSEGLEEEESLPFMEAFNEDDEFTLEQYEERENEKPVWMQIQDDMKVSPVYYDLVNELRNDRDLLREFINKALSGRREVAVKRIADEAITKKLGSLTDINKVSRDLVENRQLTALGQKVFQACTRTIWNERKTIFSDAREAVRESEEAKAFLAELQHLADRNESPVDIAVLFLSMQHGLCFTESDSKQIRLGNRTLFDFIEENEDELLENMTNPSGVSEISPSYEYIDNFCEETIRLYAETGDVDMAKAKSSVSARMNHPFFIEGYIRAATVLRNVTREKLVSAGHENFRQKISPEGNAAYHDACREGKTHKDAMREFWKVVNSPRKVLPRITTIRSTGLVLDTGREISFGIAVLKVQHNELDLPERERVRLKDILKQKAWGVELQNAL